MELQEKYRRKLELEKDIELLEGQIRLNRDRIGLKATTYDKENVQGGKRLNTTEELILKICDMERDIEIAKSEMDLIDKSIQADKEIYELFGDDGIKIFEYKLVKTPNWKIAKALGIGEATLYRKLKKMSDMENDSIMIENAKKV
jgi:hypothetical protein